MCIHPNVFFPLFFVLISKHRNKTWILNSINKVLLLRGLLRGFFHYKDLFQMRLSHLSQRKKHLSFCKVGIESSRFINIFFFTSQAHELIRAMNLVGRGFLYLYSKNKLLLISSAKLFFNMDNLWIIKEIQAFNFFLFLR